MSNIVPVVEVELDRVRHLRCDLNAMVAYERASGRRMETMGGNPSMEDVLILLWACLIHEDRELTVEAVGGMVHAGNLAEVSDKLAGLARASVPEGTSTSKNRRRSPGS